MYFFKRVTKNLITYGEFIVMEKKDNGRFVCKFCANELLFSPSHGNHFKCENCNQIFTGPYLSSNNSKY